jgi:hypothetical protein
VYPLFCSIVLMVSASFCFFFVDSGYAFILYRTTGTFQIRPH